MSDVLIKGMEMPKSCKDCTRMGISHCPMKEEPIIVNGYDKPLNCPLVEVPPHGRLIDADRLAEEFDGHGIYMEEEVKKIIDFFPTIVEATE